MQFLPSYRLAWASPLPFGMGYEVGAEESLLLGPGKENEWLILKRAVLPDGFQGRVWGEGAKYLTFF